MDPRTKSAIKKLVLNLRRTLEGDLEVVLRRYGLFTDRDWSLDEPPSRPTAEDDREIWRRLVTLVRQGRQEGRTLQEASQDYVREAAFTYLNRLVGLKCFEVRGIIEEVVTTRDIYSGRSKVHRDYREDHPGEGRAADDALPACLEVACRQVNEELIGYLFDPDDDYSMVWPRYAALKGCIAEINALDEGAWAEDEIIGWIYQFYNTEEKASIRKRGRPQTPHEVAVINQFFTPRWIVKFLVDNTLGRLWLEMHPGSDRVRDKCDYLVPEMVPRQDGDGEGDEYVLDPDSPINNPRAVPRREGKPVTRIRLLDPACGTMHFGHYACEVFDAMYRDARDWGEVDIDDVRIPSAILEYNLHGVDIDRRAVQLAALGLFMKARTMHPEARIRQVNLVVADATMPDSQVKERFLARYAHSPRVQKAFAQVLEDMDRVAELGSLLRVEERLRELLAGAGRAVVVDGLDMHRQHELPGVRPSPRQMGLAEVVEEEQAAEWTPSYTLQELRDDLRAFAREALDDHDLNAQLFATEANEVVRLLDVLMGEYDVVVMNPAYGYTVQRARHYLRQAYPDNFRDLYGAFMERALDFAPSDGLVGALTSKTFMTLSSFASLRSNHILRKSRIETLLDLGTGVLDDAAVETAAYVLRKSAPRSTTTGTYIRATDTSRKQEALVEALRGLPGPKDTQRVSTLRQSSFSDLPGAPLCYYMVPSVRDLFAVYPPLDGDTCFRYMPTSRPHSDTIFAEVKQGLIPGSYDRFVRFWWEIQARPGAARWVTYCKGGNFSRHYYDNEHVVRWTQDGAEMKQYAEEHYGGASRTIKNERYFFRQGLTLPAISSRGLNVRKMPPNCIFSDKGLAIFPDDNLERGLVLGILNSCLGDYILHNLHPGRQFNVTHLASVPFKVFSGDQPGGTAASALRCHDIKAAWDTGNEICTRFSAPWLLQAGDPEGEAFAKVLSSVLKLLSEDAPAIATSAQAPTLAELLDEVRSIEDAADARLRALQAEIDEAVYDLYEITPRDRALIERELRDRPPELVWPQMEGKSDEDRRREHVTRLFSYYVLQAVRQDADGIVPLVGGVGREPTLVDRVRAQLEEEFGSQAAYQLEQDAAEYLGRPVAGWLERYFFSRFHAKLYKRRPILWHLISPGRHFAVLLDYHRLDRDTLPKVRTLYLGPQTELVRTRVDAARKEEASVKLVADLEEELADLKEMEERLLRVIQGEVEVELPDWANGPYRDGSPPYDPDIDDGVRVNLLPIQAAGLLPVKKVV